ncbi:MAG: PorV/PorQ family protein [candidate division WOR-3 bacterium]|nr:MAG: PorV/PorQ family protein [candidate division WOR-3 bacterium]
MRKICAIFILCISFICGATRPGAVFLLIWPGARPTALSGAFAAVADDATACYYNQGGLAFINSTIISLQHANWLPGLQSDMYYEYAGITRSFKVGTFGLHVIYLTTGDTDVVDEQANYLGTYTTFDLAVGLNYGFELNQKLGLGIGWKLIYSYLVPDWVFQKMPVLGIEKGGTGLTYAFDIGMLYKPFSFLSVGTAIQNIGPNISYTESGSSDPLPYTLRIGIKVEPINTNIFRIAITSDVTKILVGMFAQDDQTFFENLRYELDEAWKAVGLEIDYYNFVKLRAGYFRDVEGAREGWTYGGGIQAAGFSIDVGVDQSIYDFPTTNRKFSFSYQFK